MFRKIGIDRLDLLPTRRRRSQMDPAAIAALMEQREIDGLGRSGLDSGLGVRLQGGRVYDSKLGVTCHWCRQKTLEEHVECTAEGCGGGARLPTAFCRMCLRNRHGEDVTEAIASGCWICPGCRGSCGAGCTICCNCGPCRKKAGLGPTHQLIKEARIAGFNNVHDYLVHRTTNESPEVISARKTTFPWGAWLEVEVPEEQEIEEEEEKEPQGAAAAAARTSVGVAHTPSPEETLASGASGSLNPSGSDEDSGKQQLESPRELRAASRDTQRAVTESAGKKKKQTPRTSARKTPAAPSPKKAA